MIRRIKLAYLRWRLRRLETERLGIPWSPDWRKVEEVIAIKIAVLRHRIGELAPASAASKQP